MAAPWICLDASFVLGLGLGDSRDRLRQLLKGWLEGHIRLAAPSLLYYEVANAAHQYERHRRLTGDAVDGLLAMALGLPVEIFGDPDLHRRALDLTRRLSLPATYDAHYVALAQRLDCELWTLDRKLSKAVDGHPGLPAIRVPT